MDQFTTITGFLKLNADDIYRCVYILENVNQDVRYNYLFLISRKEYL